MYTVQVEMKCYSTSIEYSMRSIYSTLPMYLWCCRAALSNEDTEVISCRGTLCVEDTCQSMTPRADAVTISLDQAWSRAMRKIISIRVMPCSWSINNNLWGVFCVGYALGHEHKGKERRLEQSYHASVVSSILLTKRWKMLLIRQIWLKVRYTVMRRVCPARLPLDFASYKALGRSWRWRRRWRQQ